MKNMMATVMKYAAPIISDRTTKIYGALAICLHQIGVKDEDIKGLFAMSQELWNQSINEGWDMAEKCLEVTGIDVRLK